MNTPAHEAFLFAMVSASLVAGCMPSAPPKLLGQAIDKPVTIMVRMPPTVAAQDDQGGTASMIEALQNELEARGVETRLSLRDDEEASAPRIELWITAWATWTPVITGFGTAAVLNYIVPAGKYDVLCRIYREGDHEPAFVRRFDGHVHDRRADAAVRIGARIGEKIASAALSDASE